jgi:hypothetical protein
MDRESKMMSRFSCALLVACLLSLAVPAQAAPLFLGQVVQTTYLYPNTSTPYILGPPTNATVGAGVELLNFAGFVNIDFSDTNILITTTRDAGINAVAFDGLRFFDVFSTIPAFGSVTINPATNYAGFNASRVTFDSNTIFVNVANLPGLVRQVISLDVYPSLVPEPSTLVLLGTGIAAMVRRRRSTREARQILH